MPAATKQTATKRPLQRAAKKAVRGKVPANDAVVKKPVQKKPRKPQVKTAPERVAAILAGLRAAYPGATCALLHSSPWELLVATILSAQCTDARVNMVTPELFRRFPTPKDMATASLSDLEELIRTTGFFRNKAKSISGAAKEVVARFGGEVPRSMEELLTLPGVARKTGNVVLGVAYGIAEGIVVDTHVLRLSRRLELTLNTEPKKVEQDLVKVIPQERWIDFSHELILHGRAVCVARKPRCLDCSIESQCDSSEKTWSSH